MAFGSIELTTISRAQDYTTIKHNEDIKGFVDQSNIGQQVQKEQVRRTNQVNESDEAGWHSRQFDAKEKGDNEYAGNGGKDRRRQQKHEQMVVKGRQSFDMKI